jgi:hypothetical protein
MSTLWPRLGFTFVGGLDHAVTVVDAPALLHLADALEADQARATAAVTSAAALLRQLSRTPSAIKALNRIRPQTPRSIRGMNVAAHYLVARELLGTHKFALSHVMTAWSMTQASVADDITDYRKEAQQILDKLIDTASATRQRGEILQAINADMCTRGRKSKA